MNIAHLPIKNATITLIPQIHFICETGVIRGVFKSIEAKGNLDVGLHIYRLPIECSGFETPFG